MRTKVVIDPSSQIFYSSFYIKGLYTVFGKRNISFSSKYFTKLLRKEEHHSFDAYFAFVVISSKNRISKFIIDFGDVTLVKESAYEWCDKFAKINFNENLTDKRFHDKIVSIPPGFGIKIWNIWETAYYCSTNFFKCKFSPLVNLKGHLRDYIRQYRRPTLDYYLKDSAHKSKTFVEPYIFMIGTLWKHQNCISGTNLQRKKFVEVCKTANCKFEGGFHASPSHPQYSEFKELIFNKRYPIKSYIEKTKLSTLVFNTPAVFNCHGWKLGEYLAMGKAIISTQLSNELPGKFEHGKNIHIIQDIDDLKNAVDLLLSNHSYREMLSNGVKDYYSKYGSPEKVIENILRD